MPTSAITISAASLVDQFKQITPWRHSQDYSRSEWSKIIDVALTVQNAPPPTMAMALDEFMKWASNQPVHGDFEPESQVYILMRVVFQLPEDSERRNAFSFKGWTNSVDMFRHNRANLSWPVSWTGNTTPKLLARYEGSEGMPYQARREFDYMRKHFKFRKLK